MRVTILASGSKGNASLYESGGTSILVDAGVSVGAVQMWLPRVNAIVITHAHGDHSGHYARMARKLHARVYVSEATERALSPTIGVTKFSPREPFQIGAFTVAPTPLPHDAAQVGLVLSDGTRRVGLATDLGEVPPGLVEHFRGCDALLLESNHDRDMLLRGPYPEFLKKRIGSAKGHLSNDQLGELLDAHYRDAAERGQRGAHTVALMHLSETNNHPTLARARAHEVLRGRARRLLVASQTAPLPVETTPPAEQLALF